MTEITKSRLGHEAIESMLLHLIDTEVRRWPYIALVSKKSLWAGNGRFKYSEYPEGVIGALGIKRPSAYAIQKKEEFYGYPALVSPWPYLNNITNHAVRQRILWEIIDHKSLSDIRPILGKGYIRKDGTLDPDQTQGISCYIFFLADSSVRQDQNEWIRQQVYWRRAQIYRNITTHSEVLRKKKQAASTLVKNNTKLLSFAEYREIDPHVDRQKITWNEEQFEGLYTQEQRYLPQHENQPWFD
jgi:hypothetical protein